MVKILMGVYSYVALSIPAVFLLSYFGTDHASPSVKASCSSTQVGPVWFNNYQPSFQMTCGVLSVALYGATILFFRKHISGNPGVMDKRNRRMTAIIGIYTALLRLNKGVYLNLAKIDKAQRWRSRKAFASNCKVAGMSPTART